MKSLLKYQFGLKVKIPPNSPNLHYFLRIYSDSYKKWAIDSIKRKEWGRARASA
jgi:hypothetical protein